MPVHRREAGLVDRTKMAGIRAMLKLGSSLTGPLGDGPPITTCSPSSMRRRMSRSPARPTVIGMGWSGGFSKACSLLRFHLPAKLLRRSEDISAALPVCAYGRGNI